MTRERLQPISPRAYTSGLLLLLAMALAGCDAPSAPDVSTAPSPEVPVVAEADSSANESAPPVEAATPAPAEPLLAAPNTPADTLIIPGEQVGPITSSTSRAELADVYGEAALEDLAVDVGEGFTEPGTAVLAGTDRRFTVIWSDADRSQPLRVIDFGPAWKTPEGLGLNTSFADLEAALGTFQIYGFGWDYGGTVSLEGSRLDKYHGNLFLRAQPDGDTVDANPDAYQQVLGDAVFDGGDPNMKVLKPQVYAMEVYLNSLDSGF